MLVNLGSASHTYNRYGGMDGSILSRKSIFFLAGANRNIGSVCFLAVLLMMVPSFFFILVHTLVERLLDESTDLTQEVRAFSWQVRPSVLDDLGLIPAIRSFLIRYSEIYEIDIYFNNSLAHRLDTIIEITIYRII